VFALALLCGCEVNLNVGGNGPPGSPPTLDGSIMMPPDGGTPLDAIADGPTPPQDAGLDDAETPDAGSQTWRRVPLPLDTGFANPLFAGHGRGQRLAVVAHEPGGRRVVVFASGARLESPVLLAELEADYPVGTACIRVAPEGFEIWLSSLNRDGGERFELSAQGSVLAHELKERAPTSCSVNPTGFFDSDSQHIYSFIEGKVQTFLLPSGGTGLGGVFLRTWQVDERVLVVRSSPSDVLYELGFLPLDGSELQLVPFHQICHDATLVAGGVLTWSYAPTPMSKISVQHYDANLKMDKLVDALPPGALVLVPRYSGHADVAFQQMCFDQSEDDCQLQVTGGLFMGTDRAVLTLSSQYHEEYTSTVWSNDVGDSMALYVAPYPELFVVSARAFR